MLWWTKLFSYLVLGPSGLLWRNAGTAWICHHYNSSDRDSWECRHCKSLRWDYIHHLLIKQHHHNPSNSHLSWDGIPLFLCLSLTWAFVGTAYEFRLTSFMTAQFEICISYDFLLRICIWFWIYNFTNMHQFSFAVYMLFTCLLSTMERTKTKQKKKTRRYLVDKCAIRDGKSRARPRNCRNL